ncbi:Uncharacterised protein [Klebsiella pneumoniae]|nr:Uncharacterised protein [Klebsiella pneumoniae]SLO35794.1 Uncharacterised protein [Klebsiella pneumoniae]
MLDFHPHHVARLNAGFAVQVHRAVDFRSVGHAAANGAFFINFIYQHQDFAPHFFLQTLGRDLLLQLHKAVPALFFHLFRHLVRQLVGGSAFNRAVLEAADAVETRLFQEVEQHLEIFFRFAREAHNKSGAQGQIRANFTPLLNARQLTVRRTRTLHQLQNTRAGVLQRNIEVRQNLAFRHQRDHIVNVRVRVDIVQAHPDAELRQLFAQTDHAGLHRHTVVEAGAVLDVDAVGGGVLRNHQQLFHAGVSEAFGFGQHFANRTAHQIATHGRDDAEGAAMVAAFRNF